MKVGIDGRKIPGAATGGPLKAIDQAIDLGVDGVFYRTILDMSPTLDAGELREIRDQADEAGLYLESGLGKVNPFAIPEDPILRKTGNGDTLQGFRRMMEAAVEINCLELWADTGNFKTYPGRFAYDRFRTDVPWAEQLASTERFLKLLAPIARDLGIHINLETHEEITSFELVRLVEAVGPDAVGIVFDVANPLQRGEHPTLVAERVAPYTRQSHIKDAVVVIDDAGVLCQNRTLGEGTIDIPEILRIVAKENPTLNLTIENAQSWDELAITYPYNDFKTYPSEAPLLVEIFDQEWRAGHPDLDLSELSSYIQLAQHTRSLIDKGEVAGLEQAIPTSFTQDEALQAVRTSVQYLRRNVADLGLGA